MRSATLILAATALLAAPSAAFGPVYLSSSTAPSFTTALSATKKDDVETVKKADSVGLDIALRFPHGSSRNQHVAPRGGIGPALLVMPGWDRRMHPKT